MKKKDIKKIYYNGNEITSLYLGGNLLYQKTPVYNPKRFAGKFTDDSTESDWYCKLNGSKYILPVNPETKEFDFEYDGDEITSLNNMFNGLKLERIDSIPDISNCLGLYKAFSGTNIENIDLSYLTLKNGNIDAIKPGQSLLDLNGIFMNCASLKRVKFKTEQINIYSANSGGNLFYNCENLEQIDNLHLQIRFSTDELFYNCKKLKNLNDINLRFYQASSLDNTFYRCETLTSVNGNIENIWFNINLKYSPLTNSSAMVFINGLQNITTTKTITFKGTTYDTLSEEQIALATSKGWSVVRG